MSDIFIIFFDLTRAIFGYFHLPSTIYYCYSFFNKTSRHRFSSFQRD